MGIIKREKVEKSGKSKYKSKKNKKMKLFYKLKVSNIVRGGINGKYINSR